jgi:non-specific protein-tyrosine kinase
MPLDRWATPEVPRRFRDYLTPLRRHKWLILALAVLGFLGGFVFTKRLQPSYTSSAQIEAGAGLVTTATSQAAGNNVNVLDEQALMSSESVATLAQQELGTDESAAALRGRLTVTPMVNSSILGIAFSDSSAEAAQKGAQAFADSYMQLKTARLTNQLTTREEQIKKDMKDVQSQLDDVNNKLGNATPGSVEANQLGTQRASLSARLNQLQAQLQNLMAFTVDAGTVISEPSLPSSPDLPPALALLVFGGGGLVFGLVIGIIIAYILEAVSDRIRGAADLEERLGAPVLGLIPKSKRAESELTMVVQPSGPDAEDYWTLSVNLAHAASEMHVRKLLVTSSAPNEGKSTVAANLAGALAASGMRVTLVTADLQRPWVVEALGASEDKAGGLAAVLAGDARIDDVVRATQIANLRVVPGGALHAHRGLLSSDAMDAAIAELLQESELLIVDGAPLIVADPLIILPSVDAVLYVTDAMKSTRAEAIRAREQMEEAGGRVLGAVLNRVVPGKSEGMSFYRKERKLRLRYLTPSTNGASATKTPTSA